MRPALLVLLAMVLVGCFGGKSSSLSGDAYWAYSNAQNYVTAKVPAVGYPKFADPPEAKVQNIGAHVWKVESWVEYSDRSANTVRKSFVCTVERRGELSYDLVSLNID